MCDDALNFMFISKDYANSFQECQTFRVAHSAKILQDLLDGYRCWRKDLAGWMFITIPEGDKQLSGK